MRRTTLPSLLLAATLAAPMALSAATETLDGTTGPRTVAPTTETGDNDTRTVAATAKDATITATVKAKLLADDDIAGMKIDVDTRNQVVMLKGKVGTEVQLTRAEAIAAKVDGVTRVDNQLVVGSN